MLHHKHPSPMRSLQNGSPSIRRGHKKFGWGEINFTSREWWHFAPGWCHEKQLRSTKAWGVSADGNEAHLCTAVNCRAAGKPVTSSSCSICAWSRGHQKVQAHSQICSYPSGLIIWVLRVCSLPEDLFQQLKWFRSPTNLLVVWEAKQNWFVSIFSP